MLIKGKKVDGFLKKINCKTKARSPFPSGKDKRMGPKIKIMAKESVKARQRKRERMVVQYAEKRQALKAAGDWKALDELPKNSSRVRLKNRCQITGRPRGYTRYFGLSRIALRDMALDGKIPGLRKASW